MIDFVKFLEEHKEAISTAKTTYDIFNATDYEDDQSKDFICANRLLRVIMLCITKTPINVRAINYTTIESDVVFRAKLPHGLSTVASFRHGHNIECNNIDDLVNLLDPVIKENLTGITSNDMRKFLRMTQITYGKQ